MIQDMIKEKHKKKKKKNKNKKKKKKKNENKNNNMEETNVTTEDGRKKLSKKDVQRHVCFAPVTSCDRNHGLFGIHTEGSIHCPISQGLSNSSDLSKPEAFPSLDLI